MPPVTLNDIAARIGVSRAAVAKVLLNNRSNIRVGREKTELIRKAAEEMGYRPNGLARALRLGETRMIGVMTGGLDSPFFAEMLSHAEHIAAEHNYQLLIVPVEWGEEPELRAIDSLWSSRVDGIMHNSELFEKEPEMLRKYRDIPIVPCPGVSELHMDYRNGMRELFTRMREGGVNRLALATNGEAGAKDEAYLECCREFAVPPETVRFQSRTPGQLEEAVKEILDRRLRNLLVCSDYYAMQFIHRFGLAGKRVPDDIRVASVGGTRAGAYYNPPLTAIDQHIAEAVELKMRMLFDRIAGNGEPRIATITTTLKPGGSFIFTP